MKPIAYRRAWRERRSMRKEVLAIELKPALSNRQRHAFRLETRARELTVMASLSLQGRRQRETEISQQIARRCV